MTKSDYDLYCSYLRVWDFVEDEDTKIWTNKDKDIKVAFPNGRLHIMHSTYQDLYEVDIEYLRVLLREDINTVFGVMRSTSPPYDYPVFNEQFILDTSKESLLSHKDKCIRVDPINLCVVTFENGVERFKGELRMRKYIMDYLFYGNC